MTIVPAGLSTSDNPPAGLDHHDVDMLGKLLRVWEEKRPRNVLRSVYYDGKQAFKDFGIAIPDRLQDVDQTLEWPAKGVSALVDRSNLEGFIAPGMTDDPFDIEGILADNNFYAEFPQDAQSAAVHACSSWWVRSAGFARWWGWLGWALGLPPAFRWPGFGQR